MMSRSWQLIDDSAALVVITPAFVRSRLIRSSVSLPMSGDTMDAITANLRSAVRHEIVPVSDGTQINWIIASTVIASRL